MRFTTLSFLLFFLVVYFIYWNTASRRKLLLIFITSLVFYAAWSIPFMFHFLLIVAINYYFINYRYTTNSDRRFNWIIGLNLANLFFFKYFYFFLLFLLDITGLKIFAADEFNKVLFDRTGFTHIILPLAISFYTFQLIAFQVDVKRNLIKEQPSFIEFAVFILFFPQLVAGPIVRHSEFFYQLKEIKPDEKQIMTGAYLILLGLVKKILIADNMGSYITNTFQNPGAYSGISSVLAIAGYSVQVYNDFSGYTDIARGLGRMMGLELPENFNGPYLSKSLSELWQRWHITLSTWIRDYIYIPLGGSRATPFRSSLNLIATFTAAGAWHGANYTYILWGLAHGLILTLERYVTFPVPGSKTLNRLFTGVKVFYTWSVFTLLIILFNSPDIQRAWDMTKMIFTAGDGIEMKNRETILQLLVLTFILNYFQKNDLQNRLFLKFKWTGLVIAGLLCLFLLGRFAPGGSTFIYFQF